MQRAARGLAREMRMPGFRKGKAPPSLVIQRLGFGAVLQEAIRDSLPEWYERALLALRGQPGRRPRASRSSPPPRPRASRSSFKFEIGVRPEGQARRVQGPRGRPGRARGRPTTIVDREIERIREGFAKLEPVERAAAEGDVLLIDFEGLRRRQGLRGRQGRATTCSSSAAAS